MSDTPSRSILCAKKQQPNSSTSKKLLKRDTHEFIRFIHVDYDITSIFLLLIRT